MKQLTLNLLRQDNMRANLEVSCNNSSQSQWIYEPKLWTDRNEDIHQGSACCPSQKKEKRVLRKFICLYYYFYLFVCFFHFPDKYK